jgi:hypothetical protein
MRVYKLSQEVLDRDYHGCGKAWAAIKDGEVRALRYMDSHWIGHDQLPEWVKAVNGNCSGLDSRNLPVAHSSTAYKRMAEAAQACDDCPKPPKRARYRPAELLHMARMILMQVDSDQFAKYRQRSREELTLLGDVVSGMCSCCTFCV